MFARAAQVRALLDPLVPSSKPPKQQQQAAGAQGPAAWASAEASLVQWAGGFNMLLFPRMGGPGGA